MTDDADEVGEAEATNAAGDTGASAGADAEPDDSGRGTASTAEADGARADAEATAPSEPADADAGDATTADAADAESGGPASTDEEGYGSALAARVAEHDEALAAEVDDLAATADSRAEELDEAREEIEDLTDRLKRKQAEFQNYKKRAKKRQDQIRETATEEFVEQVVTVRDNLVRALDQDEDADIRPGIESTLTEFDRILDDEGVSVIDPEPGEDVDPHRHEVMMRVDADQPSGTVAEVYQPGYEMGEKVIREAQVTVSDDE